MDGFCYALKDFISRQLALELAMDWDWDDMARTDGRRTGRKIPLYLLCLSSRETGLALGLVWLGFGLGLDEASGTIIIRMEKKSVLFCFGMFAIYRVKRRGGQRERG